MQNAQNSADFNMSSESESKYSTLLAIDVASALASACAVAPFVTMIDQAVTQNTSKTATITESFKQSIHTMIKNPKQFFGGRAYIAVALVYSCTYIAANSTITTCEKYKQDPTYWKLAATSVVNMGAGITKDSLFARWFGQQTQAAAPARSIPPATWAMFVGRDVMTIGAGFVLPDKVSRAVLDRGWLSNKAVSDTAAQLVVPMAAQTLLTPMHLLALDLYNRPDRSLGDRASYISPLLKESLVVRMARVGVVYGIAGVGNKLIRNSLRESFGGVSSSAPSMPRK